MAHNKRRSESEVIFDLLSSAKTEVNKTKLMYKANMSYKHFKKYLDFLMGKDLIAVKNSNPKGELYYLTPKGKELLTCFNTLFEKLS